MSIDEISESDIDQMGEEQIRKFLTEQGVGVLGLLADEYPYMIPMSFGYNGESMLYFVFLLFGIESRKEVLSESADRATFLVYSTDSRHEWRSVSIRGRIEQVSDNEWEYLRDAMENAWHPDLFSSADPTRGVQGYQLRIEKWTGIENSHSTG